MNSYSAFTKVPGSSSKISWQHHKAKEFQNPSCPPRLDQPKLSTHSRPTTNYFPNQKFNRNILTYTSKSNKLNIYPILTVLSPQKIQIIKFKEQPFQENKRPTSK